MHSTGCAEGYDFNNGDVAFGNPLEIIRARSAQSEANRKKAVARKQQRISNIFKSTTA